jgi:putative membrane protein
VSKRCQRIAALGGLASLALTSAAYSHVATARGAPDLAELLEVTGFLALAAGLYARGMTRVWARRARGRRGSILRALAFGAGLAVLAIALLSPLDAWGAELFAFHMIQHELLMLAAAPLLVLGRPLPLFLWAFSESWRGAIGRMVQTHTVRVIWGTLLSAGTAWMLHALALWIWHVPRFFDAVLLSRGVHDLQHLTFLGTALVFWAALFDERRRDHQGAAILYLFTTTVHTSVLGALITFAGQPWYSAYLQTSTHWGLSPLEDQQLGGLIMWVPGSLIYVGSALVLLARWITSSDQQSAA